MKALLDRKILVLATLEILLCEHGLRVHDLPALRCEYSCLNPLDYALAHNPPLRIDPDAAAVFSRAADYPLMELKRDTPEYLYRSMMLASILARRTSASNEDDYHQTNTVINQLAEELTYGQETA